MVIKVGNGIVVEHDEQWGWMAVDHTCGSVEHCESREQALEVAKRWVAMGDE